MRNVLNLNLILLVITYLIVFPPGSLTSKTHTAETFKNVSTFEAYHIIKQQEIFILDVRTDVEYAQSHLRDAVLIPLMKLSERMHELKEEQNILVYCYDGNRSKTACEYLTSKGFKHIFNMLGGIDSWIKEGYEVVN
ncbi:MAG: rhodanese-related sulfurtransferase [Candidatus Scalindua rubra]|uniref:Rhodanese-related sulfurtransferase n=1 Tax=Candidatus Scalindua rubra TaxID=1872076 RepID=A0A1E3XAA0_9BACT|nr:MAG: rhodanese-related sulfurtransferase [Candidatus Scalindua rubra]